MRILSVHCTAEMSPLFMKLIASKLLLSNFTVAQKLIVKLSIYGKMDCFVVKINWKACIKGFHNHKNMVNFTNSIALQYKA